MLLHSFMYNQSRRAPLNFASLSALKNSICDPLAKLYLKSVAFHRSSNHRPVSNIIFLKSFMAPRFKCGIDSATIDISLNGFFAAMSTNMGMIAYVLPTCCPPNEWGANYAEVPPWTPLTNFFRSRIFLIAVVYLNIINPQIKVVPL